MIRRPPRSTLSSSSAASDVYKRQLPVRSPSRCPTCPSVRRLDQHQCSKAHLPTSAPCRAQPPGLLSGQLSPAVDGGVDHVAAVSCRLSATGIRFLGILSRRGVPLPSRSAYQATSAWTPTGFPRSAHPSRDRIGCPLCPEAQRCSHDRSDPSGRRSPPLPGARPYRPGPRPISGAVYYLSLIHISEPTR